MFYVLEIGLVLPCDTCKDLYLGVFDVNRLDSPKANTDSQIARHCVKELVLPMRNWVLGPIIRLLHFRTRHISNLNIVGHDLFNHSLLVLILNLVHVLAQEPSH